MSSSKEWPRCFRGARTRQDRVAPVRELFTHIADASRFHKAVVASGKIHDVLELGQGHFARAIAVAVVAVDQGEDANVSGAYGRSLPPRGLDRD